MPLFLTGAACPHAKRLENEKMYTGLFERIRIFLCSIGIDVVAVEICANTFLPGIAVKDGKLLVDVDKLLFPGDLLHEAGHLAVVPKNLRERLNDEIEVPEFNAELLEIEAIAWSYAACLHLAIDPEIVFHEGGYRGKSKALLQNFELGIYLGIDGLENSGLTLTPRTAERLGEKPYPDMIKWCRD